MPAATVDPAPLEALLRRLRGGARDWTPAAAARFDTWVDETAADPQARADLVARFLQIIAGTRHVALFADVGVLPPDGLGSEMRRRMIHKLLPADFDEADLGDWMRRLFGRPSVAAWALAIPDDRWHRLGQLLDVGSLPDAARLRLMSELFETLKIVAARVAAIGVDPLVARVHPDAQRSASPFLEQQAALRAYVDGWVAAINAGARAPAEDDRPVRVLLDQCRDVVRRILRNTGETGVTVALTYKLVRAGELIERLEALLDLVDTSAEPSAQAAAWMRFLRAQVRAVSEETTLSAVWRSNTRLAALEVVEHAGRAGEHYIATTRSEWWAMLRSAMLGGLVIAFMAILKIRIGALHLPSFVEGAAVSLNYGLGFVLIHLLHGTVATKQPAMTAARIAAEIEDGTRGKGASWVPRVADLLVQVVRSQFIAVVGNVGVALPLAILLTWAAVSTFGGSPAAPEKAHALLSQLDPLGLTLFYAAIAGVCLFLSGVISGYCDNLTVFHRLQRRVARMPLLVRWLGPERAARVGSYVGHNFGALVGNFVFGCMLGTAALVGTETGLPIDIRHVAFSSANLGVAGTTLWAQLSWQAIAVGALGVVLIAMVNLGVSFTLSLMLALKARGQGSRGIATMWRQLLVRMLSRPLDLLRPPAAAAPRPKAGVVPDDEDVRTAN